MYNSTQQMQEWASIFGRDYTNRTYQNVEEMNDLYMGNFGINRANLNEQFLDSLDRSIKILEIGCNTGAQLQCLRQMGFTQLYGIELQRYAIKALREQTPYIDVLQGNIFNIPFYDKCFDLVFTSGILIHIHPNDLHIAMNEIYRCTKKYIWGYEYYSDKYTMVSYRDKKNLLWKADFMQMYLDQFPNLVLVKENRLKYLKNDNVDSMFLLSY